MFWAWLLPCMPHPPVYSHKHCFLSWHTARVFLFMSMVSSSPWQFEKYQHHYHSYISSSLFRCCPFYRCQGKNAQRPFLSPLTSALAAMWMLAFSPHPRAPSQKNRSWLYPLLPHPLTICRPVRNSVLSKGTLLAYLLLFTLKMISSLFFHYFICLADKKLAVFKLA